MDRFLPSIKQKYKDRLINREKQWPPCHSNKLVRLELVEREKGQGYCDNRQRGSDDKTFKRTPLAYGDLFKVESGKKPVRKVLVEGDAGIGKTTLSVSISEDWSCEKLFQEYELVLLLPLRHKKVASASSLPELLKLLHPSADVCKSVASYLKEEEAKKVLVIADGWDELSESEQHERSFLYELLFETFPLMSVVVTSRPSASAPLHRLPCIDRFVEINGFGKDDIKEYIHCEFNSEHEKACRLLEQLEDNPLVESVCSVPLNCAIVCHLWRTSEEALPSTMTQLYTKIILNIIYRNIRKIEFYTHVLNLPNFDALPKELQQSFKLLCEFAFKALKKNQIVFSQEELIEFFPHGFALDEKILCFGLLQSAETVLETGHGVSFHFLHLTFMEYLAALHLSEKSHNAQLEMVMRSFSNPHTTSCFTTVLRFYFGISSFYSEIDYTQAQQCLTCIGPPVNNKNRLLLCHCAYEAQNNIINGEVIRLLCDVTCTRFGYPRTAHDCAAVLHILDNIEEYISIEVNFSNCGVREKQIRTLTNTLTNKKGKILVKELNLSSNKLAGKCLIDLFHRAAVAFKPSKIRSGCGLSYLDLSDNCLEDSGLQALEIIVRDYKFSNLEKVNLGRSLTNNADINAAWLTTFMEVLSTSCPRLSNIGFYHNNLGVPGALAIAGGLSKLQNHINGEKWFALTLGKTNLGDKGVRAFVDSLKSTVGLYRFQTLIMSGNRIHADGISYLANAFLSGRIAMRTYTTEPPHYFSMLHLGDNPLGLEGTKAVYGMLSNSECQPYIVDLSRCDLTTVGSDRSLPKDDSLYFCQHLSQMQQNNAVRYLHLDGNSFSSDGIHILAGLIHLCGSLLSISCSDCGITSDDLIQLFDKLQELKIHSPFLCNDLREMRLDNNKIDDRGILVMIDKLSSLLPHLGMYYGNYGVLLHNNPISREVKSKLEEELERREHELQEVSLRFFSTLLNSTAMILYLRDIII